MTVEKFFEKAIKKGFENIQLVEENSIGSGFNVVDGNLMSFNNYDSTFYEVKAEKEKKVVDLETNYLSDQVIDQLVLKSELTDTFYEHEFIDNNKNIPRKDPCDIKVDKELKLVKDLESLKKEYKELENLNIYYNEEDCNTRIVNSNGVDISTNSYCINVYIEATAKKGEEVTSFVKKTLLTNKEELDLEKFAREAIEKAIIQSNRDKLTSKKYDIILDSSVAGEIISSLIDMLSSKNIRNKVSCLENKLDKGIFSKSLTIIEDPTDKKYPGYRLFDDEGTDTYKKLVIDKGKVKTYLYDIKEAKLAGKKSTANGYGGISARNMYVVPGDCDDLFKELKDGIYITDFMGSQVTAINTNNGQISIQVFGFIVKDGKLIKGFVPAVLTTTIFELLSNIEKIGSDLVFTNTVCGSPSILIRNISIAS